MHSSSKTNPQPLLCLPEETGLGAVDKRARQQHRSRKTLTLQNRWSERASDGAAERVRGRSSVAAALVLV